MSGRTFTARYRFVVLTGVLAGLLPMALWAHRLDEILQTMFITVEPGHVDLDLTLTPGLNLAAGLFTTLDQDRDGVISPQEAESYARKVASDLTLEVDDTPLSLKLVGNHLPIRDDLLTGRALIRLSYRAEFPPLAPGEHHLTFRNSHQTNASVYLVNALVPESKQVEITRQTRDLLQLQSRIEFKIGNNP